MEQFEAAKCGSIDDEIAQQAYDLERVRGIAPSKHSTDAGKDTRQVESGQTQPGTGA